MQYIFDIVFMYLIYSHYLATLIEEFYPPINSSTLRKNMGAIRIDSADVNAWYDNQHKQIKKRMLILADILKSPIKKLVLLKDVTKDLKGPSSR